MRKRKISRMCCFAFALLMSIASTLGAVALASAANGNAEKGMVYYNPEGGIYFHENPYCIAVNDKYLPLTPFLATALDGMPYSQLRPCSVCVSSMYQEHTEVLGAAEVFSDTTLLKVMSQEEFSMSSVQLWANNTMQWQHTLDGDMKLNAMMKSAVLTQAQQIAVGGQDVSTEAFTVWLFSEYGEAIDRFSFANSHALMTKGGLLLSANAESTVASFIDWAGSTLWQHERQRPWMPTACAEQGDACYVAFIGEDARGGAMLVDGQGNMLWEVRFPSDFGRILRIVCDDGGAWFIGSMTTENGRANIAYVSADGTILWRKQLGVEDHISLIMQSYCHDNQLVLAGKLWHDQSNEGRLERLGNQICFILRLDRDGNIIEEQATTLADTEWVGAYGKILSVYPAGDSWCVEGWAYEASPRHFMLEMDNMNHMSEGILEHSVTWE